MNGRAMRLTLVMMAMGVCPGAAVATQAQEAADAIYTGGAIVTVDDRRPSAEAIAVKGGRIVAVGRGPRSSGRTGGRAPGSSTWAGRRCCPDFWTPTATTSAR